MVNVFLKIAPSNQIVNPNLRFFFIRGDQGQNRRTDQPGRKRHPGGEKQAISLRNSHPDCEVVIQPAE